MDVSEFDYELPTELIAQEPIQPRDAARLMVINRATGSITHSRFSQLPRYLHPGDALIINNTKVIPARLKGRWADTGGKVEVLLLRKLKAPCNEATRWEVLIRPARRARPGMGIVLGSSELRAEVVDFTSTAGGRIVDFFMSDQDFRKVLDQIGEMPLPPYIKKEINSKDRYQTVYARYEGSAAAPTAGLHFTPELLQQISDAGIQIISVLLHVGIGTFLPVRTEQVEQHSMHSEYYWVGEQEAMAINQVRQNQGRVIAVGTTCVRTLETVTDTSGRVIPGEGWTDLFIYPGYRFRAVDGLITNFHLPRSTLLMLVSAFAGRDLIRKAYEIAIQERYRFFSFGDAMLIL